MKRSIVVNKLESLLNNVDNDKIRLSNKLLAVLILGTVEEMGMFPPIVSKIKTENIFVNGRTEYKQFLVNEWDEE
jgi:hypothetical protein